MEFIVQQQDFWRPFMAIAGLHVFFVLGLAFPLRRSTDLKQKDRWFTNLALLVGNGLLLRLFVPFSLIEISLRSPLTRLPLAPEIAPQWLSFVFGVLLLDFVIYWQHRLFHKVPWLWRLHRVHHSDVEFDATTAGRFHPAEIFLSFLIKAVVVSLFAVPAASIVVFEIVLNFASLFNHANFDLPTKAEGWVQKLIVTPHLHRIHHSTSGREMNRNFGFSISVWDFLFASFLAEAKQPQNEMPIGLHKFRSRKEQTLWSLLRQPLQKN